MISGANQVWHSAGWLEGGLTMSYEKFVLDLDHCGMLMQMMKGIQVNEETLAKESYYESGPGENFLSTAHTLRNFATANYQSSLPDIGPYETWSENGSLTAAERANGIWKAMLANYEMPHMDESVDEALKDFMARRKESMPDEWY
jgi:trimethylamine--corrinoid protein Co-methyltransferase